MRSFLTMLGIIIGVAAVISMLAMGAGAKKQIMDRISAMGTNLLFVHPEQANAGGVRSQAKINMKLERRPGAGGRGARDHPHVAGDQQRQPGEVPQPEHADATSSAWLRRTSCCGTTRSSAAGRSPRPRSTVSPASARSGPRRPRTCSARTTRWARRFASRTSTSASSACRSSKGDQGWANPDDNVHVPYTVAMKELFGMENVQEFYIQVAEGCDIEKVQAKMSRRCSRRAPPAERPGGRLQHPQPERLDPDGHRVEPDVHVPAGRDREHLAAGRRDRDHEHHAGDRDRADPGDRRPQGDRREGALDPAAVPDGGADHQRPGRAGRSGAGHRRGAGAGGSSRSSRRSWRCPACCWPCRSRVSSGCSSGSTRPGGRRRWTRWRRCGTSENVQ